MPIIADFSCKLASTQVMLNYTASHVAKVELHVHIFKMHDEPASY